MEAEYGEALVVTSTAERVAEFGKPLPSTRAMSRFPWGLRSATASVRLNDCPIATDMEDWDKHEMKKIQAVRR